MADLEKAGPTDISAPDGNLTVANTIRFLGNNYTGAYHDIKLIVSSLCTHGIAETLIEHYSRVMTVGCPNHFNATTMCDNSCSVVSMPSKACNKPLSRT